MKIDKEEVAMLALQISELYQEMVDQFPKEMGNAKVLKHLGASSIHMSMFMKDFIGYMEGDVPNPEFDKLVKQFLDHCGCKDE